MNIENKNSVMVFRFDGQYGASYSIGLSKKNKDGQFESGFMPCRFKKDVEISNQTKIYLEEAWLSFNVKDKKTYPYIFINKFRTVEEVANEQPHQQKLDEIEITDEDFPF